MTIDLRKVPEKPADWDGLLTRWQKSTKRFDENEPRDWHGRWTTGGDTEPDDQDMLGRITVPVELLKKGSASKYLLADGSFTPERQALHDKIVEDAVKDIPPAQGTPRFFMLGGGPASGKSMALASGAIGDDVPNADEAVFINADDIKTLLPEGAEMLADGNPDWAAYTHEESSYLAKRIQAAAIERKQDFVLDGTGDNSPQSVLAKINAARDQGYEVDSVYVTCDTDTAVQRANDRGDQTGRYVAEPIVRATHRAVSEVYPQVAKEFDHTELVDTNGGSPRLIARGTRGNDLDILDPLAYQAFLDKANG